MIKEMAYYSSVIMNRHFKISKDGHLNTNPTWEEHRPTFGNVFLPPQRRFQPFRATMTTKKLLIATAGWEN